MTEQQQQHPITPPPELVEQWCSQLFGCDEKPEIVAYELAHWAARWGADQELEAVCDEILHCAAGIYEDKVSDWSELVDLLRDSRRPKPPSLKEQALKALRRIERGQDRPEDTEAIRRALEQLDD